MTRASSEERSRLQRVENRAKERKLSRADAMVTYAMDRLLYRLGRSAHVKELFLKGGVLVANLMDEPHRFTRDIDLLRRHGPPDPGELREVFRQIVAVPVDDGVQFDPSVRAEVATREMDDYDGVKVVLKAWVGKTAVDVKVDIGCGDAVIPAAHRMGLVPFLEGDPAAEVFVYPREVVLAEKIQTVVTKFPAITHRLKDILDVITFAAREAFEDETLLLSLRATFERRRSPCDARVLDDMRQQLGGKKWETAWAKTLRDKAVVQPPGLQDAVMGFDVFVRPLLRALREGPAPGRWRPGGPWSVSGAAVG